MMTINKKILIVEDDEDFRFILEKKFTIEGFSIVTARDGQEGVAMADKEKPDIILSDILMPKMDGIEMARAIRLANATVPIILLTNIKDSEATIDVQRSGEFDYLVKSDTRINEIVDKVKVKLGIMQ